MQRIKAIMKRIKAFMVYASVGAVRSQPPGFSVAIFFFNKTNMADRYSEEDSVNADAEDALLQSKSGLV